MRALLLAGIASMAASSLAAETTVAVLEFGKGGTVRRTASSSTESSVKGVGSFWNVMHRRTKRSIQHAGMTLVPDIFNRADAGVVVGISGNAADVAAMPTVASLLEEHSPEVVGHVHVPGKVSSELMNRASKNLEPISDRNAFGKRLQHSAKRAAKGIDGLEVISLRIEDNAAAADADKQLREMFNTLKTRATDNGKTVVLHLVVETAGASGRNLEASSRRLNEDDNKDENKDEENRDEDKNEDKNENNRNQNQGGYSRTVGDRSMVQIQYFNVVLWTALGLTVVLGMTIGAFMDMPLMADTLLFGESAKMIGAE